MLFGTIFAGIPQIWPLKPLAGHGSPTQHWKANENSDNDASRVPLRASPLHKGNSWPMKGLLIELTEGMTGGTLKREKWVKSHGSVEGSTCKQTPTETPNGENAMKPAVFTCPQTRGRKETKCPDRAKTSAVFLAFQWLAEELTRGPGTAWRPEKARGIFHVCRVGMQGWAQDHVVLLGLVILIPLRLVGCPEIALYALGSALLPSEWTSRWNRGAERPSAAQGRETPGPPTSPIPPTPAGHKHRGHSGHCIPRLSTTHSHGTSQTYTTCASPYLQTKHFSTFKKYTDVTTSQSASFLPPYNLVTNPLPMLSKYSHCRQFNNQVCKKTWSGGTPQSCPRNTMPDSSKIMTTHTATKAKDCSEPSSKRNNEKHLK